MELLYKLFLNLQGPQIVERGDLSAHLQPRTDVFAVLRGSSWKKSLLRVEKARFNPGDMIARVFGFIQQGDRDVGCFHARFAEIAKGGIKGSPHVRRERVKKELTRNTQTKLPWISPQRCRSR